MRKQTEQQIQKNKIAGYGYIDKRDCQKRRSLLVLCQVFGLRKLFPGKIDFDHSVNVW